MKTTWLLTLTLLWAVMPPAPAWAAEYTPTQVVERTAGSLLDSIGERDRHGRGGPHSYGS